MSTSPNSASEPEKPHPIEDTEVQTRSNQDEIHMQWNFMIMQENALLRNTVAQLHTTLLARDVQNKELQMEFDRLLNDFKDHMERKGETLALAKEDASLRNEIESLRHSILERDQEIDCLKDTNASLCARLDELESTRLERKCASTQATDDLETLNLKREMEDYKNKYRTLEIYAGEVNSSMECQIKRLRSEKEELRKHMDVLKFLSLTVSLLISTQDLSAINNSLVQKNTELQEMVKQHPPTKSSKEDRQSGTSKKGDMRMHKELTTLKNSVSELENREV